MNYKLYLAEDFAANESFIAYYLKTDEQAVAFWKNWISRHPEKLDEIYNAEYLLSKLTFRLDEPELQDEFTKFDVFLNTRKPTIIAFEPEYSKQITVKKWAFLVVVSFVFSFSGYFVFEKLRQEPTYITYHNGDGRVSQFSLSDGSKITLSSNSTLKYPKLFKGGTREVELDGEGFFEVTKDKTKPFSVMANGLKTTVLGTKFNILAYKNQSTIQVALIEGKVEVQTAAGRDKLLLNPSEMAIFNMENGNLVRSSFNARNITAWRNGIIVFDHASFEEVAIKLKNVYGITLINNTKRNKWSYSGEFEKADYLTIIKSICFARKINYTQKNQTFTLKN